MPTLVAQPCPNGPVVVSTPEVSPIFGMARAFAVELAKPLDVVQSDRQSARSFVLGVESLDPGEMQHRVKQHRGMAGRQDEAVAVRPGRILGIEAQYMRQSA